MACRSFKSLHAGAIPPLLLHRELHDSAALPANLRLNNWIGNANSAGLTRSGITASPDSRYIAWVSRGRIIRILDWEKSQHYHQRGENVDENQAVQRYLDEATTINCKKVIFSICFGKLDDRSKRRCARPLNENFHKVLNFPSETGHIVAAGYQGGEIDLWQVSTGTRIISLVDHKGAVRDLRFAPNGSLLLLSASADGVLKIWDCQDDGNLLKTLVPLHQTPGRAPVCAWSPDASLIAGTGNSTIVTWDVDDISTHRRKCPILHKYHGHQNFVNVVGFSPDGSLLFSGGNDCMLILWSTVDASLLRVFRSVYPCASPFAAKEIGGQLEQFAILDAAFHPRGDHVTAVCASGVVRLWGVVDEADDPLVATRLNNKPVGCVVFDSGKGAEAKIVVVTVDCSVLVFDHPFLDDSVSSLQHLARKAFRQDRRHVNIEALGLPTRIERFLKMEEFKPELRECGCESRHHQNRIGRAAVTRNPLPQLKQQPVEAWV